MRWYTRLTTSKVKIYAVFQFITLIIIFFIAIIIALLYNNLIAGVYFTSNDDVNLGEILSFSYRNTGSIFLSLFLYGVIILQVFSWIWASLIFRFKARSIFDTLFTLFFFIPLLSNIIALIAQITKLPSIGEIAVDEQAIYDAEWVRLEEAAQAKSEAEIKPEKTRLTRRRD